jgi:hypothetical protein
VRHVLVTGAAGGIGASFVTGAVLRVGGGATAGTTALPIHHPTTTTLQEAAE